MRITVNLDGPLELERQRAPPRLGRVRNTADDLQIVRGVRPIASSAIVPGGRLEIIF